MRTLMMTDMLTVLRSLSAVILLTLTALLLHSSLIRLRGTFWSFNHKHRRRRNRWRRASNHCERLQRKDSLTFSDRTHQHNGAAFDANGLLDAAVKQSLDYQTTSWVVTTSASLITRRENNHHTATVTADKATSWFLLVDNRLDGEARQQELTKLN